MIQLEHITKIYDTGKIKVEALKDITLTIPEGSMYAITGPSGSGKSTMMHIIGCLDTPNSGDYRLAGMKVSGLSLDALSNVRTNKIGFVFQSFNLLPYLTAEGNVEMPMIFAGKKPKERKKRVKELLDRVGMTDRAHHKPNEMSGGQQQRIAIARALANDPDIILADEPTGNLDTKSGAEILELFNELWKNGKTIIMITHESNVADICKNKIHLIDGMIVEHW
jgi:putative ABC transport system ATP-binding protein